MRAGQCGGPTLHIYSGRSKVFHACQWPLGQTVYPGVPVWPEPPTLTRIHEALARRLNAYQVRCITHCALGSALLAAAIVSTVRGAVPLRLMKGNLGPAFWLCTPYSCHQLQGAKKPPFCAHQQRCRHKAAAIGKARSKLYSLSECRTLHTRAQS